MDFSTDNKRQLLDIASKSIHEYVLNGNRYAPDKSANIPPLNSVFGAFVSVYADNKLRGCLGRFKTQKPLFQLIARLARSAASEDSRFKSIQQKDLRALSIEISILSPLQKIESINEIVIGKHGIYMNLGAYSGTLLPQIAVKNNWNTEQFIAHCLQHKLGIDAQYWKEAEIYTYEALVFSTNFP